MTKTRLEAFSDGVLAIIITIMVLEMKPPQNSPEITALKPIIPIFLSYVLSFVYLGVYWNNHHHLLHTISRSTAGIMWANLNLLFWLSLIPFVTAWNGANNFAQYPTALYGFVLLMSAFAYWILERAILTSHGKNSLLAKAIGSDFKGKISLVLYSLAILSCYFCSYIANLIYMFVAIMWLVPDKRIEKAYYEHNGLPYV